MKRDLEQLIHDLIGIVFDLTRRPGAHSQLALDGFRRDAEELRDRLGELEPAQPQPRGEGDAGKTRGYTREDIQANTWWPGKGGEGGGLAARLEPTREGDDLAARLDGDRLQEWFTEIQASASLLPEDLQIIEAMIARASTHPEQSARVEAMEKALLWYADPDHWLDGQAGEWIVEEGNHVSGDGFAHNEFEHDNGERARAALEPAPEGEGEARAECPTAEVRMSGERDDLAARLEARADNADKMAAEVARNPSNYGESGPRHHARLLAAAYAFRKAAEMARASTHPEQWVSGDDREWLLWITSYVLNRHEFTDSAATDARAALTRIATAIKQPPTPTADLLREAATTPRASTHPEQSALVEKLIRELRASAEYVESDDYPERMSDDPVHHSYAQGEADAYRNAADRIARAFHPASSTPTEQGEARTRVEWHDGIEHGDELALRQLAADIGCGIPYGCQPSIGKWYAAALDRVLDRLLPLDPAPEQGEARVEASENDDRTDVSRRMNRWREHLGDDRLNGFGGRGPAEYAFMAENEPEGPGLSRFGEDCGEAS